MRKTLLVLSGILAARLIAVGAPAPESSLREPTEWCDIWVTSADKTDLPRVLLIGDSITKNYFAKVENHLQGKAFCARLATSKCLGDPEYLAEVELVLKRFPFKVIHVNNGLHGWKYTEAQYQQAFTPLLELFKKHAPAAALIWAQTTPVMKNGNHDNERTGRVKERNRIAGAFMSQHAIPINDLYGLVEQHPEFYSADGVHLNATGVVVQARQVADMIVQTLQGMTNKNEQ